MAVGRLRTQPRNKNRSLQREKRQIADTWLDRLSHLSQFGLFLFTVGNIYFTVIPLYQKALLDEAIAKKEIDLIEATKAVTLKEAALSVAQQALQTKSTELDNATKALAQTELNVYQQQRGFEIDRFLHFVGAECSGLLIRPPKSGPFSAQEKHFFCRAPGFVSG